MLNYNQTYRDFLRDAERNYLRINISMHGTHKKTLVKKLRVTHERLDRMIRETRLVLSEMHVLPNHKIEV